MDPIIGAIIGALITGGMSLCGVMITNSTNDVKMQGKFDKNQAVTDEKMDRLRDDVKEIAEYTKRVPVMETEIVQIKADMEKVKTDIERLKSESYK